MCTPLAIKDFSLNCVLRVSGAIKSYCKVTNKPSCFAIPLWLCYSSQFILVLRLIPLLCLQIRLRKAKTESLSSIYSGRFLTTNLADPGLYQHLGLVFTHPSRRKTSLCRYLWLRSLPEMTRSSLFW